MRIALRPDVRKHRPPRLDDGCYVGVQRYFVTICTFRRRTYFTGRLTVRFAVEHLLPTAFAYGFEVIAYCFMPDHVHLLLEATREDCNFRTFVALFKQRTAYEYRQRTGGTLWQESFYDHVLRREETTPTIVAYVIENPVRAGLCRSADDYPHIGSTRYSREELWRGLPDRRA